MGRGRRVPVAPPGFVSRGPERAGGAGGGDGDGDSVPRRVLGEPVPLGVLVRRESGAAVGHRRQSRGEPSQEGKLC